ncbi:hypothetical protein ES703_95703 [subsurface metagenome]
MRINLDMTLLDAVVKMAGGNPGATRVMCELMEPNLEGDFMDICRLDDLKLYGPDIWLAYKDVCGMNIGKLRQRLRNNYHQLREDVLKIKRR